MFRTRQQVTCEMFICRKLSEHLVEKIISGGFGLELFIQTVKCYFFNQIIVYQSFYGAPLTLIMFYFKENFCVLARVGKSLVRCLSN